MYKIPELRGHALSLSYSPSHGYDLDVTGIAGTPVLVYKVNWGVQAMHKRYEQQGDKMKGPPVPDTVPYSTEYL